MNHRLLRVLLAFILCSLSLACSLLTPKTGQTLAGTCANASQGLAKLHSTPLPEHLRQENPVLDGSEFDPSTYFDVLTHLSMQPGYTLDYVYQYDFMGSFPVLYARPADVPRFVTSDEYYAAGEQPDWRTFVQTDGSEAGFLELAVLYVQAGEFYLGWHANYHDDVAVCSRENVKNIVDDLNASEYLGIDALTRAKAALLQPTPAVEMQPDRVLVTLYTFTKWGGFYEEVFTFQRDYPHTLLDLQREERVKYDCGIMF